jgi:hypothetical protein
MTSALLTTVNAGAQETAHSLTAAAARASTPGKWVPSHPPSPAVSDPLELFNATSCPVAGYCVAVGAVSSRIGLQVPLVVTKESGTTRAISPAMPANRAASPEGRLFAVACAAVGACVAAGTYVDASAQTQGLILTLRNGAWTATEAALPADADTVNQAVDLDSVSCPKSNNCAIAGTYRLTGYPGPGEGGVNAVILTQSRGRWTTTEVAAPTGEECVASVTSVSCAAVGDCVAVGSYASAEVDTGELVLVETKSGWTATAEGGDFAQIVSVSCPAPGWCAAVGNSAPEPGAVGVFLTYSHGTWQSAGTPAGPFAGYWDEDLSSVSCPEVARCTMVGEDVPSPVELRWRPR